MKKKDFYLFFFSHRRVSSRSNFFKKKIRKKSFTTHGLCVYYIVNAAANECLMGVLSMSRGVASIDKVIKLNEKISFWGVGSWWYRVYERYYYVYIILSKCACVCKSENQEIKDKVFIQSYYVYLYIHNYYFTIILCSIFCILQRSLVRFTFTRMCVLIKLMENAQEKYYYIDKILMCIAIYDIIMYLIIINIS